MGALNALAETLRYLLEHRQYRRVESLLERCPCATLEQWLALPPPLLGSRARYLVREHLRLRRRAGASEPERPVPMKALQPVLNIWCWEGHRAAIRSVLRELDEAELGELAGLPELDTEVVSMTREFMSPML